MNKLLLIIDPQNSFMDSPAGSLAVPGATQDMKNLATHIENNINEYNDIIITLDTHYLYHIAHRAYWIDENNNHPDVFTQITLKDFLNKKYRPVDSSKNKWVKHYLEQLEAGGRYTLMVWPDHCINGTEGHQVQEDLLNALNKWENNTNKKVKYVLKGMNPDTESYSVFKAEVVIDYDKETQLKENLINEIDLYENIEVAGEALSHCVSSSVDNLIEVVNPKKITLLPYMSNVVGFEKQGQDFLQKMEKLGSKVIYKEKQKKLKF